MNKTPGMWAIAHTKIIWRVQKDHADGWQLYDHDNDTEIMDNDIMKLYAWLKDTIIADFHREIGREEWSIMLVDDNQDFVIENTLTYDTYQGVEGAEMFLDEYVMEDYEFIYYRKLSDTILPVGIFRTENEAQAYIRTHCKLHDGPCRPFFMPIRT